MADFQTHITISTAIGACYGFAGYFNWDVPIPTAMLAAGLCSVAGMLPDIDSDSGQAQREVLTFAAAAIPLLMTDRFEHMGLTHESMVLAGGCIYVLVRFGMGAFLRAYTVHRGMWHSIPAAVLAGLGAWLICSCEDVSLRLFRVFAVVIGYLTHLVLDEMWAIESFRGRIRFKNSFGTALKMFSRDWWPNLSVYGALLLIGTLAINDPALMEHFGQHPSERQRMAREWIDEALGTQQAQLDREGVQ